jgi:hypothetical protein
MGAPQWAPSCRTSQEARQCPGVFAGHLQDRTTRGRLWLTKTGVSIAWLASSLLGSHCALLFPQWFCMIQGGRYRVKQRSRGGYQTGADASHPLAGSWCAVTAAVNPRLAPAGLGSGREGHAPEIRDARPRRAGWPWSRARRWRRVDR